MIDLKNKTKEEIDKIRDDYKNYGGLVFNDDTLYNPLQNIPKELEETPHLYYTWLLSRQEYLNFFCSEFLNVNPLLYQSCIIQELWNRKFPMLIGSRGLGKTWMMAVYVMIRATLLQGRKIVVAGASFRQSKLVYEYCCQIWNSAPLLRDSVRSFSSDQGPKGGNDAVHFKIGESTIIFIPIGTGGTIRGLRANDIIVDEFSCLADTTLVETSNGLERISDCINDKNLKLYNRYGNLEIPTKRIKTPLTDVYQISVRNGYSFKCSSIHKVLTTNGWKLAKDLTNKDSLIFENNYKFPTREIDGLTENIAELIGLLVSEGSINNKNYISISGSSSDLMEYLDKQYKYLNPKIYTRKAYIDYRGWNCKECYAFNIHNTEFRKFLLNLGLDYSLVYDKKIPWSILQSPRNIIIKFLNGLFNGDGSCFVFESSGKTRFGVAYYSVSEQLIDELQVLLFKLGYISNKQVRKSKISNKPQWMLRLNGQYAYDLAIELNIPRFNNIIKEKEYEIHQRTDCVNFRNGYYCAEVYYMGRSYNLGSRVKTYEKAIELVNNFLEKNPKCFKVKSVKKLKEKEHLYDFTLPETHSFIGNGFIQHNSHNKEIFENVIAGFAAVQGSPHEKVAEKLEEDFNNMFGFDVLQEKDDLNISNQIIISGTAYYHFNHFAQYWERWHKIISSKGRPEKLKDIFPDGIEEGFDWKDYSIIRIPYNILPNKYMDDGNIARSKATLNSGLFTMEMEAVFSKDSDGFFKATLIESCVASDHNEIEKKDGLINFFPRLSGDHDKRYYMGVDTASQVDNFAIVIIEAHKDHRRIVYCWTTNTKEFKQGRKSGIIAETDFFRYCSGKIRSLMSKFQIERIAIDSQGGGRTIYETLHDKASLKPGEQMIWEAIEPGKIKETDSEEGLHIIEMVNFRKQEYTLNANHGLKKDFEDKVCLFPEYNPAILASYANLEGKFAQEMEDCIENIEELKRELTLIVVTSTATGNERFDTPENKASGVSETSRNKKDRYSALIMANASARKDYHDENDYSARSIEQIANNSLGREDAAYIGPAWIIERLNNLY